MGKGRVTPLKPVTTPCLELTAALVSIRVSEMLSLELRYDKVEEEFWTNSTPSLQIECNRLENALFSNSGSTLTERTTPLTMLRVV